MAADPQVLIIGGGIAGVTTAYELAGRGLRVTVIDKGRIGYGCSYGNAGWITPCFAMPLPMPGMLIKSFKWMLDPEGPLYIEPRPSIMLMRWMLRFLRSMNQKQMQRSITALTELSTFSLDAYHTLDQELDGSMKMFQRGLLMVAQTPAGKAAAVEEMELVAPRGIPGEALDADGVRKLEPAVTGPKILGGVYFPKEAHLEPLAAVQGIAKLAEQRGVTFIPGAEVFDFQTRGSHIEGLRTTRGLMKADQYVLATGAWSTPIARRLKLNVPILSGKGYALTVDPFDPKPAIPMMLIEKKIAVTPRENSVRLAGTMELVGVDESITARRVDAIVRGAREYLNVPESPVVHEVWRGLRPCTPDGVPIIGRPRRWDNLVVAAGHQMLGMQTGPGSGRLTADIVCNSEPTFDPAPFDPNRF